MKQLTFILVITLCLIVYVCHFCTKLAKENYELKINQKALLDSANHYKVLDSLNAIKITSLTLNSKDYKKYRTEDYKIAKELTKHEKLSYAQNVQSETTQFITTIVHDTIYADTIYADTIYADIIYADTIKAFNYRSKYTDIDGLIWPDSIQIKIANREELIITQSIEKKKFLGIRLPIWLFGKKQVNTRVVSKNPNTQIINSEFVNIK